jgi:gas vesicle protein
MADRDLGTGFAIGFGLGALIGLAIGFLFAPQAGDKTRELIRDKADDIPETIREVTADREKVYAGTWKKRRGLPKVSDTYFE